MFESITMNFLTQPKVVAAVDIFRALQTAATSLKNNLMIFAAAAAVASIVIGGLFGMATLFLTKIIRCCECCGVMAPIALDNEHPRI
ncbi:hypothetical protein [Enterococcus avium]|jgi:hypothetical protein|uniref:hypothetical protein n=1 Tax=Enterococcus avium TaxID=33945 RepID=UPI0013E37F47|nr:hypothetical protein [Enterococcus avium]